MRVRHANRLVALFVALAFVPLTAGCGGDDGEPTGGNGQADPLLGTWTATSFVVDGLDIIAGGTSASLSFFSGGSYSFSVTNDDSGFLCEGPFNCIDFGDFTSTSSTIVLEPGTVDEISLNYTLSGTTLTLSGSIEGRSVSATFQKVG